jgi:cyclo(L-tyrosyl-L-tyrosyl) synthase
MHISYQENFVSDNCKKIYLLKNHGLLGISPFNSYFSEEKILSLLKWTIKNFNSFNIFIPDTLPIYTFLALDYEESKAKKKTQRQVAYLKNKIFRALNQLGYSEHESTKLIINISSLERNPSYVAAREKCYQLYNSKLDFQNACNNCTDWVLNGYNMNHSNFTNLHIAVRYLLDEMPLFINSTNILNTSTSIFIYHQFPSFINYLYNQTSYDMVSKHQGFIYVNQKADSKVSFNELVAI